MAKAKGETIEEIAETKEEVKEVKKVVKKTSKDPCEACTKDFNAKKGFCVSCVNYKEKIKWLEVK